MRKAIKNQGKLVSAWQLGKNSEKEREMISEGRILLRSDGSYELFSQEARDETGETALPGDWFKVDSKGFPYPNAAAFFESHHRHIDGDVYEQIPRPVDIWLAGDEVCEEVRFLIEQKSLVLDEAHPEKYFTAPLWGTVLTAAKDAVLVFYSVTKDEYGAVTDADFNFVERGEFEKTYSMLP